MGKAPGDPGNGSGERSSQLSRYDTTSLVVGAVVGADIYVVASLGSGLMGPAMLVAWVIAGVIAGSIALSFAQCAAIVRQSGGPYVYAERAFGPLAGFLSGWALYLAELINIAILPLAFVRYLGFFFPGINGWQGILAKLVFVAFLTVSNYVGTRTTGRVNDVLTIGKLAPLLLLVILGLVYGILRPATVADNLSPFAPLGWAGLGSTVVLTFWAYAGFELAVLPAEEITDPQRTLPFAMVVGMAIATAFYLLVNAVTVAVVPWQLLAASTAPLALALQTIIRGFSRALQQAGGALVAFGAVLSISGADESAMLGTARLSYAMAADGLFPHFFARLHPRFRTPYLAVLFQGVFALVVSILGSFTGLIRLSVLLLLLTYLATVLAALHLTRKSPELRLRHAGKHFVPWLAIAGGFYLAAQVHRQTLVLAAGALLVGILVYIYYSPRRAVPEAQILLRSRRVQIWLVQRALRVAPARVLQALRELWEDLR